jgi:hypothetical protein
MAALSEHSSFDVWQIPSPILLSISSKKVVVVKSVACEAVLREARVSIVSIDNFIGTLCWF